MSDESLFREVDEEVRQEQLRKLWSKYGTLITGVAVGIVVAVAGFKGWQYWQVRQSEAAGETFFQASALLAEGKRDEAIKLLGTITHPGYAALAKFRLAAALAEEGKGSEAVQLYDQLAGDTSLEPTMRQLARVRAGYIRVDTETPDELLKRLGDLDQEQGPWRHQVREIIGLAAWRVADYQLADRYMNTILADRDTPVGLRQRAQMMADLLTPLLDKPRSP